MTTGASTSTFPPVLLASFLPHPLHVTSRVEVENIGLSSPQSGHFTRRKLLRGFGMNSRSLFIDLGADSWGLICKTEVLIRLRGVPSNRFSTCERCGVWFQVRGWRQNYCLQCRPTARLEYARKQNLLYYHRHPARVKETIKRSRAKRPEYYREQKRRNQTRRRDRIKQLVLSHYSNGILKCVCCGETERDFLTLDHINGGGGQHRVAIFGDRWSAGARFYSWLGMNHFPPGFQLLCMNCNFSKGKHGQCAHKTSGKSSSLTTLAAELGNPTDGGSQPALLIQESLV